MLVTLTPDFISNQLVCPPGKRRIEFVDQGGLGLYVEVRASSPGVGTYYLRYKDANGKTCHQKIGSTAVISLADARKEAKRLKAEITLGADPRAEAKARKAVITYAELFESALPAAREAAEALVGSIGRDSTGCASKAAFGGKRLNQITRHQIAVVPLGARDGGPRGGHREPSPEGDPVSLNLARQWGMLEGENPAARIADAARGQQGRALPERRGQLQRLLDVLRTDRNQAVCRVALFLLSTGCRLNEALSATWADVDIERRVFTIRATNSKSRKLRSVPLNDSAIEVLTQLETRDAGRSAVRRAAAAASR